MAEHRKSSTARTRAELARVRAELRAVTDAISPPDPPGFAVADTAADGSSVLRPVVPRRRAVRDALRGSRYPALILPLALAWRAVKWPLLHMKAGVAGSKIGLGLGAALVAMSVPTAAVFADYTTRAVPAHHAVSQLPTAPAAAVAPAVLHRHAHHLRLHGGRAWNPKPAARSSRAPRPEFTPAPVPGEPGPGLPSVQPTILPAPQPTVPVPSPTPPGPAPTVPPLPHLVRHLLPGLPHPPRL